MKPYFFAALLVLPLFSPAAESLKFSIRQYRVEGNSVLPDARVQSVLTPFSGNGRDFADVQHALEALEALYRREGFGALQVYLPEQELNQGTVVLKVVEPKLGKVFVEGNQYFGVENVRRSLPALKEGYVPNTGEMGRNLRLANESPSRQTTVTLQAGETPQVIDAKVTIRDEKPWRAFVSLDNTGSAETGNTRLSLGVQHANLFDLDHVLTAQATGSPKEPDKVKIFGIGYKLPVYALGDSLSLIAGYSSVESGALQGLFNVNGKGAVAGAHYIHTLSSLGSFQHKLNFGVDWRRFDTVTTFGLGGELPGNRYTIQPVSLAYQAAWQDRTFSLDGSVGVSRNVPTGEDLALVSGRSVAKSAYSIARFAGNAYVSLPAEWTAHAVINAQATNDPLPSGEQFGLGGVGSVRGFEERIFSNDQGLTVNLEAFTPELGKSLGLNVIGLRAVFFYDWGKLTRNQPMQDELEKSLLAGAGIGLRMGWSKSAAIKLDVAKSLKEGGSQNKGDTKAHFSAVVSY